MPKRILVIDDDEDILEILKIVFQEEGYDVVLSNTGVAAEHIQIIHPDLILLDVRIEGSAKMGNEICAELKDMLANQCGADFYINKPFDVYQLLIDIKKYLV
jgi:two-component system response regulator VicR